MKTPSPDRAACNPHALRGPGDSHVGPTTHVDANASAPQQAGVRLARVGAGPIDAGASRPRIARDVAGDIPARRLAALVEVGVPIEPRASAASTFPHDMWSQVANFCDQSSVAALRLLDKTAREGATVAVQSLVVSSMQELDAALLAFGAGGVSAVTLRNVPISIAECQRFAAIRTLTRLDLSNCSIGDEGAQALAASSSITHLDLQRNAIGPVGARALAACPSLTTLRLDNEVASHRLGRSARRAHGVEVARALAESTSITELTLDNYGMGPEGAQALANNRFVTKLRLRGNVICTEGARALAANKFLAALELPKNFVGDEGARLLAASTSITELDLENNYIADEGAQALAVNTLITKLNLSDNDISDAAALFLADNTNSNSLDLTENMLGESGRQALENVRSRFESLQF